MQDVGVVFRGNGVGATSYGDLTLEELREIEAAIADWFGGDLRAFDRLDDSLRARLPRELTS